MVRAILFHLFQLYREYLTLVDSSFQSISRASLMIFLWFVCYSRKCQVKQALATTLSLEGKQANFYTNPVLLAQLAKLWQQTFVDSRMFFEVPSLTTVVGSETNP